MLGSRLNKAGFNPDQIAWKSIFWADVQQKAQACYLNKVEPPDSYPSWQFWRTWRRPVREFVVKSLSDAAAYRKVESESETTYEKIHEKVRAAIEELYKGDLNSTSVPLVVLAHSLGGHIMSNYIWNAQKDKGPAGLTDFEKFESLSGIVTFGCNIPLFTFAHSKVEPITFPRDSMSESEKKGERWLNFYDPDDILGYPLKPINDAYCDVVNKDIKINVGGLLANWNPASHGKYWKDRNFIEPVSKFLIPFLQ